MCHFCQALTAKTLKWDSYRTVENESLFKQTRKAKDSPKDRINKRSEERSGRLIETKSSEFRYPWGWEETGGKIFECKH